MINEQFVIVHYPIPLGHSNQLFTKQTSFIVVSLIKYKGKHNDNGFNNGTILKQEHSRIAPEDPPQVAEIVQVM